MAVPTQLDNIGGTLSASSRTVLRTERLAASSRTFLRTAILAQEALCRDGSDMDDGGGALPFDFSPAVLCYAKVLENEVNLSIVQWARRERGVEMPEFFDRYCRDRSVLIYPDRTLFSDARAIDLNLQGRGRDVWVPLALGQAKLACNAVVADAGPPVQIPVEAWQRLLLPWKALRDLRNDAAHVAVMPESAARNAERQVAVLGSEGHFSRLASLRTALAPPCRRFDGR